MAIAKERNIGLILYDEIGIVEVLDLNTLQALDQITSISHPYQTVYDAQTAMFWIVDSTGYLYKLNALSYQVILVSGTLGKPVHVSISKNSGTVNVVDQEAKKVIKFDRNGTIRSEITYIQDQPLIRPERFLESEENGRQWLVDDAGVWDRIYCHTMTMDDFLYIDSLNATGDLVPVLGDTLIWIVNFNGIDSSVMQLSASGTRPLEIKGLYIPYDIEINPNDGTLLIADTGNGRVLHYDAAFKLIGKFSNLNFPVKVIAE
jgi:DNA-binding beta-propeller fold protein YncE